MKIKDFVKNYSSIGAEILKDKYIKDNIKINSYVPFVKKNTLADNLINISNYKQTKNVNENGYKNEKTNTVKVNSVVRYFLFCRIIIENYTDLEIETEGFFEEYDLLKQSGLLDKLIISTEVSQSIIPAEEIAEFKALVDMKQQDFITNYTAPHSYISSQIERFGELIGVASTPIIEKISQNFQNYSDKDANESNDDLVKIFNLIK